MKRKALFVLLLALGWPALADKVFGSLQGTLGLAPSGTFNLGTPTFRVSYFTGDVAKLSNRFLAGILYLTDQQLTATGFGLQLIAPLGQGMARVQSYKKEKIVVDWPIGTWQLLSDLGLSWDGRQNYLWNELNVLIYGLSFTGKAALGYRASPPLFVSGLGLELGGTTLEGMGVTIRGYFGAPAELADFQRALALGLPGSLSEFRYSELSLTGIRLACLGISATFSLEKTGSFSAKLDWKVKGRDLGLTMKPFSDFTFLGTTSFSTQAKSLKVELSAWYETICCLTIYMRLVPSVFELGSATAEGIKVTGIGLWDLNFDGTKVNVLLATGKLYRKGGDDLGLRAYNYYVDIEDVPLEERAAYVETPYDTVVSIERYFGNSSVALDFRFCNTGGSIFGLGVATFDVYAILAEPFEIWLQLALDPVVGLQKMVFQFKYSFYVYW